MRSKNSHLNLQRVISVVVSILLVSQAVMHAQDMDKELSDLAEKLADPIKEHAKKKVAVIDFTDLQGSPSGELGKYIAEQLTVDLVMGKRDFSVLDRANLKSILAEHKLTATGLVDPENAKKLGMFSGVDALILGTITPKNQNVLLTAKIITTDTAEIVGAARAVFKEDADVKQLLAHPAKEESATATPDDGSSVTPNSLRKPFGDLQIKVESLRVSLPEQAPNSVLSGLYAPVTPNGLATLTLIITNTSKTDTYGVAFPPDFYHNIDFRNNRQDWFEVYDVQGIGTAFAGNNCTDIAPSSFITVVAKSRCAWRGKPGDYRPYRFQTLVTFGIESKGQYANIRKYNLIVDIK